MIIQLCIHGQGSLCCESVAEARRPGTVKGRDARSLSRQVFPQHVYIHSLGYSLFMFDIYRAVIPFLK